MRYLILLISLFLVGCSVPERYGYVDLGYNKDFIEVEYMQCLSDNLSLKNPLDNKYDRILECESILRRIQYEFNERVEKTIRYNRKNTEELSSKMK